MRIFIFIAGLMLVACNRWQPYMGNSHRDKKYRVWLTTAKFKYIPDDKIPNNCGMVLDSFESLIDRKTHYVIGKQWYDFKDGSNPGIYYITMPTKWELRRYENEKKYIYKKYGAIWISHSQLDSIYRDTANIDKTYYYDY